MVAKKLNMGKIFRKLGLNKPIKLRLLIIIIRSIFSEDGKFYPQLSLDDASYDVFKFNTKTSLMMKELITIKIQILQDFVVFTGFGFL